jgi:hypothetical protein
MQTCTFVCAATFKQVSIHSRSAHHISTDAACAHVYRASGYTCLQAESVNELVGARTAAAADSALAGLTGGIGATVQRLRLSALTLLAELEVWVALKCLLLLNVTVCIL